MLRHYWDKEEMSERPWSTEFNKFHLGIVFSKFPKREKSKNGFFINSYLIGINLLVIKSWVVISLPNFFKK
jgi:hypothetical protein